MNTCRIRFEPSSRTASAAEGTDLLTAAIAAGVWIHSDCGGDGICGECKVIVRSGDVFSEGTDRITEEERRSGTCLACRTEVRGDVVVDVPIESRVEGQQILTEAANGHAPFVLFSRIEAVQRRVDADGEVLFTPSPLSTKTFLRLPPPSAGDNISDLDRLLRALREDTGIARFEVGLTTVRRLGRVLRDGKWQVTVTYFQCEGTPEVVHVEPGDTTARHFAVVLDVGTTTLVASLVDLNSKKVLGTKGTLNPQSSYGEDVITRIVYAGKEEGLHTLHRAVVGPVNEMIASLASEHRVSLNDVTAVVSAGNTTMTHLLLGIDPSNIRRAPYVPAAAAVSPFRTAEAGIRVNPRGRMTCLPCVSSYVGGDITAGVLATGLGDGEQPSMLIDLGTNGEIVLGNREWLVCCSASAGPAFEGSGVTCGVLAMRGAVQRVAIYPPSLEPRYETIGGVPPVGICGSGYIDALSALFTSGLIDRQGSLNAEAHPGRIRPGRAGLEFVVARAAESATGRDIVVSQPDIHNMIRSKGAIYAAARALVRKVGLTFDDVETVFISGGFGSYLNIEKAIRIGLLPDLPPDRFRFVGNSSLAGARLALLSGSALRRAHDIAGRMTNIELCDDPAYMDEYVGSLFLPHTDISLFPTVRALAGG